MQQNGRLRVELLAEVAAIAPILAEHAPQSEKLGRLDDATVEALRKPSHKRGDLKRDGRYALHTFSHRLTSQFFKKRLLSFGIIAQRTLDALDGPTWNASWLVTRLAS